MRDPELKLYHFPGACSRVSLCALEMAQLNYSLETVNVLMREQQGAAYQALSPFGKIPVMLVDGEPLIENAGIISLIAALRPNAGIFPASPSPRMAGEIMSGLSLCVGTFHPQVRGVAHPERMANGDPSGVRDKSVELLHKSFNYAERRLAKRGWWLGEFSILDVYVDWIVFVSKYGGFDPSAYPQLCALEERLSEVPAYSRMQKQDSRLRAVLGL